MRLIKAEQETVINFDNSTQTASIYTASPQMMRMREQNLRRKVGVPLIMARRSDTPA
ncbi:MAG: hypothetical protein PUI42_03870 [Lachnospiraceae bacterium]|nr:hypothetical protein [Lachnospiraceae bacterium]